MEDVAGTMLIGSLLAKLANAKLDEAEEASEEEVFYTEEEEEYLSSIKKRERKKIKKLEDVLKAYSKDDVPFRFRILKSNLEIKTKSMILNRLDQFYMMDSTDTEYHKLNRWLEGVIKVPFGKHSEPMVAIEDGPTEVSHFLTNTKQCLDDAVYGHKAAKDTILQSVAMMITNPKTKGNIIALQGPMGNGKTTLVKKGIAKAMNRPFAFIALGGATDSCFLEGHDFTYEGSQCGRIVDILKECGTMDPIIYFDELDKISETPKGEEIENLLCHLTDHSQNNQFHDKYYSGIDFDLSKATFVFSFNDKSRVNPILLDRMNVIETKGFETDAKLRIAKCYLMQEICDNVGFPLSDLIFTDEVMKHIITTHTDEKGVRNLKRCLETIVQKVNLLRITEEVIVDLVTGKSDADAKAHQEDTDVVDDTTIDVDSTVAVEASVGAASVASAAAMDATNAITSTTSTSIDSSPPKEPLVEFKIKNMAFPLTVTKEIVDVLLKKSKTVDTAFKMMYT